MIEIAKILIQFGMDFQYENNGADGEIIQSHEMGLKVYTYKGKIEMRYYNESKSLREGAYGYQKIAQKVQEYCIQETTGEES